VLEANLLFGVVTSYFSAVVTTDDSHLVNTWLEVVRIDGDEKRVLHSDAGQIGVRS